MGWIDAAKGGAILLVVIGHAWRAIASRDLISADLFQSIDTRIYAFSSLRYRACFWPTRLQPSRQAIF